MLKYRYYKKEHFQNRLSGSYISLRYVAQQHIIATESRGKLLAIKKVTVFLLNHVTAHIGNAQFYT